MQFYFLVLGVAENRGRNKLFFIYNQIGIEQYNLKPECIKYIFLIFQVNLLLHKNYCLHKSMLSAGHFHYCQSRVGFPGGAWEQFCYYKTTSMTPACFQIPISFQMKVKFIIMKLVMGNFQLQLFWMTTGDFFCYSFQFCGACLEQLLSFWSFKQRESYLKHTNITNHQSRLY